MEAPPKPGSRDRAGEIFADALELPHADRPAFVRKHCASQPEMADSVLKLLQQFENLGSFLDKPAATAPDSRDLAQGLLLGGRFRLGERLGQGGMGVVYRAEDLELREVVALKLVREMWLDDPAVLARFRDEIRLARKIGHPNVCRLHDLFTCEVNGRERAFFTMEYLPGESLSQKLLAGWTPSPEEILQVIRGIAAGLDAAHSAGIVHRDLKPANVLLTTGVEGGSPARVVVMDFGLARLFDREEGGPANTVQIAGSPDYMAPEQFLGEHITAASDVFALAVIVYEMANGRRPWPAESLFRAALRRVQGETGALDFDARIPAGWIPAIQSALARDPAARPQTAAEFVDRIAGGLPTPARKGKSTPVSRRTAILGTAAAGTLAAFYGISRFTKQTPDASDSTVLLSPSSLNDQPHGLLSFLGVRQPRLAAGSQVLVTDIANASADPQVDGVAELFRSQLDQSTVINLIAPTRLRSILGQMGKPANGPMSPKAAREAAWRAQAAAVVFGTVTKLGPDFNLTIQVETRGSQPQAPAGKNNRSFAASDRAALMQTVRQAALWVRLVVGESAASVAQFDRLPEDATTPDWEALSFFARGERFAQDNKAADALLMLDSALSRDPAFTLAAMRKGDLLMSLDRQAEGLAQWRAAIGLLAGRPVTRREELRIRGMYAFDSSDYELADKNFSQWALEYPHDLRPLFYRTIPLILSGHPAEAAGNLERVVTVDPAHPGAFEQLVDSYVAAGNFPEARRALTSMRKLGTSERCDFTSGQLEFCNGNFRGSWAAFSSLGLSRDDVWQTRGTLYRSMLLAEAGRWDMVAALMEKAVKQPRGRQADTDRAFELIMLAFACSNLGAGQRVPGLAQSALEIENGPVALTHLGAVLARTGHYDRVRAIQVLLRDKEDMVGYKTAGRRIAGEVALMRGQQDLAGVEFRAAAALEPRLAYRDYLARYLTATGAKAEAYDLNARIARNPFVVWWNPMRQQPGVWGQAVRSAAQQSTNSDPAFARLAADLTDLPKYIERTT